MIQSEFLKIFDRFDLFVTLSIYHIFLHRIQTVYYPHALLLALSKIFHQKQLQTIHTGTLSTDKNLRFMDTDQVTKCIKKKEVILSLIKNL